MYREGILIVGIKGRSLSKEEKSFLRHPLIAGVILFSRNFQNKSQLTELIESIHDIKPSIVISVDHECQRVQRFQEGFSRLPSPLKIGCYYDDDSEAAISVAYAFGLVIGVELRQVGIDFSFAPVLDLARSQGIIEGRAFDARPQVVTILGRAMVRGLHDGGLPAIGKHFPGHGSVDGDTHTDLICDTRIAAEIEADDVEPYRVLIQEKLLDGIMVAHIVYSAVSNQVASLSDYWLHSVIRDRLSFEGFVCSDDLDMTGCDFSDSLPLKRAVSAGCDAFLICQSESEKLKIISEFTDNEISHYNQLVAKHWEAVTLTKPTVFPDSQEYLSAVATLEHFNDSLAV